jgi:phage terminase large subunit GpA-like protein
MKKRKAKRKVQLTCPSCKGDVYDSNLRHTLGRRICLWGTIRGLEREDLIHGSFQWACDDCLNSGRALIGNPAAPLYCDFDPYLAYVDVNKICEKCGEEYVFQKEEQKYWYETLRFWIQSKPKHCHKCRQEIREERKLNNELSELLKEKERLTIQDMERLAEIYEEINKPHKSRYYNKLVERLQRKIDQERNKY